MIITNTEENDEKFISKMNDHMDSSFNDYTQITNNILILQNVVMNI